MTSKLFDDGKQGLTYESVKECCKFQFDVIELSNDEAVDEAGGYEEIIEALKNNIWSNVKIPGKKEHLL